MLQNHLRVALRSLRRRPGETAINIAGLALGLSCCLLLLLYVRSELAVDADIPEADRIYRLGSEWADGEAGLPLTAPAPMGPALVEVLPEVEAASRLWAGWLNVHDADAADQPEVFRRPAYVADTNTLALFGWSLRYGDPATALEAPRSVVIHERLAEAVFGMADAVGQRLLVETFNNGEQPYTVTGVWADRPHNSFTHFGGSEYEIIASFVAGDMLSEVAWTGWGNRYLLAYLKLAPDAEPDAVEAKLPALIQDRAPEAWRDAYTAHLEPFASLYLDDANGRNRKAVHLLAALAGLILVVACINFANLATARALDRAREVGVRKAVGAHRAQLIGSLLGEALLVAAVATVLGAGLARILQGPFFRLVDKPLVLAEAWGAEMLLGLAAVATLTGLLAGAYPALFLSSFRPVHALRGTDDAGRSHGLLRRVLVVTQFATAVTLVAGAGIVHQQTAFLDDAPVGFDREHVVAVRSVPRDWSPEGVARLQPVKAKLAAVPGVRAVSLSWETAAEGANNTFSVRRADQPEDAAQAISRFVVDADYDEVYRLKLVAGDFFPGGEDATGVVLNERAAELLGVAEPGVPLIVGEDEVRVRGIVRDFHFESMHREIQPLVIVSTDQLPLYRAFSLRLDGDDVAGTLAAVRAAWQNALPAAPFDYTFVSDDVEQFYDTERRVGMVVGLAAAFAVLVAVLGLFGLVSLAVLRRRREIGVRKVLGARVVDVVALFVRDFGGLVLAGAALAVPFAYWIAGVWLDGFAYRIEVGPRSFLLAGGLTLALALALVALQAARAAFANPVDSLRTD